MPAQATRLPSTTTVVPKTGGKRDGHGEVPERMQREGHGLQRGGEASGKAPVAQARHPCVVRGLGAAPRGIACAMLPDAPPLPPRHARRRGRAARLRSRRRAIARVPDRFRRASEKPGRVVVCDRRARRRGAALGLSDHLLPRRDRPAASTRAASPPSRSCSRTRRSPTSMRGACATTSASRAAASASRRRARATPTSCCATGASRATAPPAQPLPRPMRSDRRGFAFDLALAATQPVLLQGVAGLSRKGPRPEQSSRYYSQPQLAVAGRSTLDGEARTVSGRAWLDHEWSDACSTRGGRLGLDRHEPRRRRRAHRLPAAPPRRQRALGRRQLRRRPASGRADFAPGEVVFEPGARWTSARRRRATRSNGRSTRRPAASRCARCSTTRSSTAAPAPARSTGRA